MNIDHLVLHYTAHNLFSDSQVESLHRKFFAASCNTPGSRVQGNVDDPLGNWPSKISSRNRAAGIVDPCYHTRLCCVDRSRGRLEMIWVDVRSVATRTRRMLGRGFGTSHTVV